MLPRCFLNISTLISSVQFSSVAQSCPTLCDPMNRSTPGLPVHHQLPEFTETHIHRVSDAIQPSHPLLSPSPSAPNPSQHQSFQMSQLFTWGSQSTGVSASASFLPKNTQGWSPLEWAGWTSLQSKGLSYVTTGKTIALTRQTFISEVMSLLFNMLSRLVITFLPRSKRLLISWLQSTWIVTIKMVVLVLYNNGNNFIPKLFYDIGTVWFKGTMMRNYGYIKIYCPSFSLSLYAIYNRLYLNKV